MMKVQLKGFRIRGRWDIKVVRNVCARKPFPDIASSFLFAFSQERSVVIPPSDTFSNFDKNFQLLSPHLIHFQLLSPIWYFRKSIQSLSPHLIPFPILKSVWRPHMPFSKSKIMQKLNSIFIGKDHIFHNTMYQKIPIHEKLYNQDAQFSQRIFCCHTTFYHKANTTKSPVPNFAGMSCYCWWGGSKRACQTSSGKGTPCGPWGKEWKCVAL